MNRRSLSFFSRGIHSSRGTGVGGAPVQMPMAAVVLMILTATPPASAAEPLIDASAFALTTPTLAALSSTTLSQPSDAAPSSSANANPSPSDLSPTPPDTTAADPEQPLRIAFGSAGSSWLTFGAGWANNFAGDNDLNLTFAWSRFLADDLEFGIEAAPWYFAQEGDDTVGLSGSLYFRWHFLADKSIHLDPDWTIFAEAGIGMLFALDEVPDSGTTVDFLPRVGAGITYRLDDHGNRLVAGLRWHHISNGRFDGDEQNPARDGIMLFLGVQVPF